jgi:hypothetical protein
MTELFGEDVLDSESGQGPYPREMAAVRHRNASLESRALIPCIDLVGSALDWKSSDRFVCSVCAPFAS